MDLFGLFTTRWVAVVVILSAGACQRRNTLPAVSAAAVPDAGVDSIQRINDRYEAAVLAAISGRERAAAESVFTNIRLPHLKSVPADQFVGIMNGGYAKALGVTCVHCHTPRDFASDEKRAKRAAREMALMHFGINRQLERMEHLATQPPDGRFINCATCHRGMVNPRGPNR
ncbi:MAG: photosynthetic reaction center cytochrome c subunit family protein [Gemmatimonadaceae bacterium]